MWRSPPAAAGALAGEQRIEAAPAARLVHPVRAEQHAVAAGDEPLRVIGRVAAHHADGVGLGDVLGDRQQLRHRLERLAQIVLVEPGDDHAHALIGQRVADIGSSWSKNCPSSMPTTSVSGSTASSSSRDPSTARDSMRISLCDTM